MNIIQILEKAKHNTGIAYKYEDKEISFAEVYQNTLSVASFISALSPEKQPIAVISNKNIHIPSIYLGIAYSNCYYIPISSEMPQNKVESILDLTKAQVIICDDENFDRVTSWNVPCAVKKIDECVSQKIDLDTINARKDRIIDQNPLYILFTSGSTGTPKGVVACHSAVVDYVQTFAETFDIQKDEIFGNQAPLDYIAGIRDIYIPLWIGCKTIFIPKKLFLTPKVLIQYLNDNKVTTICWVSAALSLCCQLNVFGEIKPQYVKKVFFTGSVFDHKYLNMWKKELPDALFVNHYGPTEITASCTYYVVDNSREYDTAPSIGKAFKNREVFVLNENNQLAGVGEVGEICVMGNCLALGYYKNPEKTSECFVQNPLNDIYPQIIYKTGDLGYLAQDGNLMFVGRKDNQIKHMGHRVELGEIDYLVNSIPQVNEACTVYDTNKSVITLYYSGSATPAEISKFLRENLPSFMIPRKLINLPSLPKLFNGKIDRQSLKRDLMG